MSDFLDQVQRHATFRDRDHTLEAVRAVFCGLMYGNGEAHCREVAELLPGELETVWKPSLFTCLREHRSANGTEGPPDFTGVVQRRMPRLDEDEVDALSRAVLRSLEPYLSRRERARLTRLVPDRLQDSWEG